MKMNITNYLKKVRYETLSDEKTITICKSKKDIDNLFVHWISYLKDQALKTESGIISFYYKSTGRLITKYRFKRAEPKLICCYNDFYVLAELVQIEEQKYELRYRFIYDRFSDIFNKIIGVLTLIPFFVILLYRSNFELGSFIYSLALTGILSMAGIYLFFMKKEKPEERFKALRIFESHLKLLFT